MSRPPVEFAAFGHVANAERVRQALRGAPAHIKKQFPSVFPPSASGSPTRKPAASAKRAATPKLYGSIVGTVAPGLSVPVFNPVDRLTIAETFTESAWRSILADIREGRRVDFRFDHHGMTRCSTSDGTLRFEVHPGVGLMFEARFHDDARSGVFFNAIPLGGADVSMGFSKARTKLVSFRGQTIRVVHHAELDHICVVQPGSGLRGAYPAARCLPVHAGDPQRLASAWTNCRAFAWDTAKRSVSLPDLCRVWA